MIRKFFIASFIQLWASTVFAQWPPGGVTPSEPLKHLRLPGSRFVPSSKRWNLVWADQLVPGNFSAAQIKFAAEHYAATQKIWDYQVAQFRKYNANFLTIIYHLAAGLNPLHNGDCPDPKSQTGPSFIGDVTPKGYDSEYQDYFLPWLTSHNIVQTDPHLEAMFQHYDQVDSLHRVWHQDPAWLMNLADTNWQNYMGDICLDWMKGNADDGCFFDVAVETYSSLYNPKQSNPTPGNYNWWQAPHGPAGETDQTKDLVAFAAWQNKGYKSCYQNIYKRFHTGIDDYLILPNTDQMVTTVYDPIWTDGDANGETIDGVMMESFGSYRGQDMWLSLERGLRHITGRGKILIAQFYGADSAERLRRTAMYMLIKNENSFLNILNANGIEWYPEYEIDLGDQSPLPASLDAMRVAGSSWQSVWARDYANGKVFCNTSDAAIEVDIPAGNWSQITTGGGGKVNTDGTPLPQHISYTPVSGKISIPAGGGVILKREDNTSVRQDENLSGLRCSIIPNPVHEDSHIEIVNRENTYIQISLIDQLGKEISNIFSGEFDAGRHTVTWNASSLPSGLFHCLIRSNGAVYLLPVLIVK